MLELHQSAINDGSEAAKRVESLSCMAFGLSHEFNNMLAAILSNAEAARGQVSPDDPTGPYLDRIKSNTRTAIALTQRIQMFTENGAAACETVYLAALAAQIADEIRAELPKSARLHTEDLDPTCTATAIPHLVHESIVSLLWNAIESLTEQCGDIIVRVTRTCPEPTPDGGVTLGRLPTEPCSALEIEDNGSGIAPTAMARILDPFFTTRLRARGLGLVPVVGLVNSCRVSLQINSEPDKGTTVRLFFAE
jgi:two-component system, cell cycle sensor histidine kinase and response regulator CckA